MLVHPTFDGVASGDAGFAADARRERLGDSGSVGEGDHDVSERCRIERGDELLSCTKDQSLKFEERLVVADALIHHLLNALLLPRVVDRESHTRRPGLAHLRIGTAYEDDAAVFDEHLVHQRERDGQHARENDTVDLLEVHARARLVVEHHRSLSHERARRALLVTSTSAEKIKSPSSSCSLVLWTLPRYWVTKRHRCSITRPQRSPRNC